MDLPVKKSVRIDKRVFRQLQLDNRPQLMALTEMKFSDPLKTTFTLKEELVLPCGGVVMTRLTKDLEFSYELLMQTAIPSTINPMTKMEDLKMRIDRIYTNYFAVNVSKVDCLKQISINTQVLLFFLAEKAQADKTFLSHLFPYPIRQANAVAELVDFQYIPQ
jgi:hypothetical protein